MLFIFKAYLKTNYLIPFLAFCATNSFFALFLAAMLIEQGVSQSDISLHYILVFSVPFMAIRYSSNDSKQVIGIGVFGALSVALLIFETKESAIYTFLLAIISGLSITTRDQINQFHQYSMLNLSQLHGISFQALTTASLVFAVVLSTSASFLFSFFIDSHFMVWGILLVVWAISITLFFLASRKKTRTDGREPDISAPEKKMVPIRIPWSVTAQCAYSMILGASYYVGKFFILPYLILDATSRFGLEDYSFPLIATVIGVISMIGMIGRLSFSVNEINDLKLMRWGFRADLLLWMSIFINGYFITRYDTTHPVPYVLILMSFIAVEFTSKIWTIGFFGVLRWQAEFYANTSSSTKVYKRFMAQFGSFKSLGGLVGFAWVYLMSGYLSLYMSAIFLSAMALIYDIMISNSRLPLIGKKHFLELKTI
jgi:hypothetical protein